MDGYEELLHMIYNNWKIFDASSRESTKHQFACNLKQVKNIIVAWVRKKKGKSQKELIEVEQKFASMFESNVYIEFFLLRNLSPYKTT